MKFIDKLMKKIVSDEKLRVSLSKAAKSGTADSFLKSQGLGAYELTDDEAAEARGGSIFTRPSQNAPSAIPCHCNHCRGTANLFCSNPSNVNEHYYICDTCYAIHLVNVQADGSSEMSVTVV